jgi:hypothetical protein
MRAIDPLPIAAMCGAFTDSQRARRCWLTQSFADAFDTLLIGEGRV